MPPLPLALQAMQLLLLSYHSYPYNFKVEHLFYKTLNILPFIYKQSICHLFSQIIFYHLNIGISSGFNKNIVSFSYPAPSLSVPAVRQPSGWFHISPAIIRNKLTTTARKPILKFRKAVIL